jgi:hypothetical protein
MNIALSELDQKDPRCFEEIKELLATDEDQILYGSVSNGHTLSYIDIFPVGAFDQSAQEMMQEHSLVTKEMMLVQSLEMGGADFEAIAASVFKERQVDLYPCLVQLLENQRSDATVTLLQNEANRVGAPYNRFFALLCLAKLGIEQDDSALSSILDFSREQDEQSWRPPLPWMSFSKRDEQHTQQQTAAAAKLYIGTIETLAERGTPASIQILCTELGKAPKKYLPFVVASLLHATI